jgi:hypothetical protein
MYLSGPSICGFFGLFEADYGDPSTPYPYCRVTPSRIGSALLPFKCPRCEKAVDFTNPDTRECYHDTRKIGTKQRNNYYCPCCGCRFFLNLSGMPFKGDLDVLGCATSAVETIEKSPEGFVDIKRKVQESKMPLPAAGKSFLGILQQAHTVGTDVLGCCW